MEHHLTQGDIFIACLGAAATIGAAIIVVLYGLHMQNRSDKKKADSRMELLLIEHPLHSHGEFTPYAKPTDVLTVEGLRFPRNGNK